MYAFEQFNNSLHSADEIARLHLAVRQWQVEHEGNVFSDIYNSQTDLCTIESYYIEPGGNFFVAHDQITSQIVGFVAIKNEGDGVGVVKRMAVVPEYHRRGIATALVGTAVGWARLNGFTNLALTTGMRENAKSIYERFGFREIGRIIRNKDFVMLCPLVEPATASSYPTTASTG